MLQITLTPYEVRDGRKCLCQIDKYFLTARMWTTMPQWYGCPCPRMPVSVVYGCGLQSRTMWALCWTLGDYPKGPGFLPLLLTMLVLDELVVPKPRTGSAAGRRLVLMLILCRQLHAFWFTDASYIQRDNDRFPTCCKMVDCGTCVKCTHGSIRSLCISNAFYSTYARALFPWSILFSRQLQKARACDEGNINLNTPTPFAVAEHFATCCCRLQYDATVLRFNWRSWQVAGSIGMDGQQPSWGLERCRAQQEPPCHETSHGGERVHRWSNIPKAIKLCRMDIIYTYCTYAPYSCCVFSALNVLGAIVAMRCLGGKVVCMFCMNNVDSIP